MHRRNTLRRACAFLLAAALPFAGVTSASAGSPATAITRASGAGEKAMVEAARAYMNGEDPRAGGAAALNYPTLESKWVDGKAGYKMQITASRWDKSYVTVTFQKTDGSKMERHSYSFTLPKSGYTASKDLTEVKIASGRKMGRKNKIAMKSKVPSRAVKTAGWPGCKDGSILTRSGKLSGRFKFGQEAPFKKISFRKIPLKSVWKMKKEPSKCTEPPFVCPEGHDFYAYKDLSGGRFWMFSATHDGDKTRQWTLMFENAGKASVARNLSTKGPASDLTGNSDATSATVTAQSPGTGSATYTATPSSGGSEPFEPCNPYTWTEGTVTGDMVVDFEIGTDPVLNNSTGSLTKYNSAP